MISLLGFLGLFSALPTSYTLLCISCGSESPSCSGNSTACPPGRVCGSSYRGFTIESNFFTGKRMYTTFSRRCVYEFECGLKGNSDLTGTKQRESTTCCFTDNCTPPVPTLLPSSDEPNGVICPSCKAEGSCNSSETLNCTGSENRCLLVKNEIAGRNPSFIRGCGTQSLCHLGTLTYTNTRPELKNTFTCTSGGISIQNVVLTLAVVCLLLQKWLF